MNENSIFLVASFLGIYLLDIFNDSTFVNVVTAICQIMIAAAASYKIIQEGRDNKGKKNK